ncbi:hypothetical protein HMI54_001049 [Coelomomyces lativittatus]|nr:hypothetical protein HMI56_003879 [Coelomomyces lativittatus]KAJ1509885.1 hypothetical protein HMI55_007221 [Coelomomyces lativittatus]KAJ1511103.1 hypothetical protein HMI54_001049 [Coelomomyces lativittatus]
MNLNSNKFASNTSQSSNAYLSPEMDVCATSTLTSPSSPTFPTLDLETEILYPTSPSKVLPSESTFEVQPPTSPRFSTHSESEGNEFLDYASSLDSFSPTFTHLSLDTYFGHSEPFSSSSSSSTSPSSVWSWTQLDLPSHSLRVASPTRQYRRRSTLDEFFFFQSEEEMSSTTASFVNVVKEEEASCREWNETESSMLETNDHGWAMWGFSKLVQFLEVMANTDGVVPELELDSNELTTSFISGLSPVTSPLPEEDPFIKNKMKQIDEINHLENGLELFQQPFGYITIF